MTAHVSKPPKSSGFKWIVPEPFAFLARPGNGGSGNEIGMTMDTVTAWVESYCAWLTATKRRSCNRCPDAMVSSWAESRTAYNISIFSCFVYDVCTFLVSRYYVLVLKVVLSPAHASASCTHRCHSSPIAYDKNPSVRGKYTGFLSLVS